MSLSNENRSSASSGNQEARVGGPLDDEETRGPYVTKLIERCVMKLLAWGRMLEIIHRVRRERHLKDEVRCSKEKRSVRRSSRAMNEMREKATEPVCEMCICHDPARGFPAPRSCGSAERRRFFLLKHRDFVFQMPVSPARDG